jgi:hypothetical protein
MQKKCGGVLLMKVIGILLIMTGAIGVVLGIGFREMAVAIFPVIAIAGGVGFLAHKKFAPVLPRRARFAVKLVLGAIAVIMGGFVVATVVFSVKEKSLPRGLGAMIGTIEYQQKRLTGGHVISEEYRGNYTGYGAYEGQKITVGKNSITGAVNISGIRTVDGGSAVGEGG